jgi:hypothetical protein
MFELQETRESGMGVSETLHFLFLISFVILSEARILSEEKPETFPRAFTVAEMFLLEKLRVAYLVENFSALITKEQAIPYSFVFLGSGKIIFVGTASSLGTVFHLPDDG